jgi:hypothetical protein
MFCAVKRLGSVLSGLPRIGSLFAGAALPA